MTSWRAGRKAIQSMTGCYLVDYSFVETESLRPGYVRDPRVYDVNRDKSVKEWISAEPLVGPEDPAPAHPVRHGSARRGPGRQRAAASVGGLGVRRAVPVRVRRPAALGGEGPARLPRPLDEAHHEPRRRAALSVRGALEDRHRLSGVVVLELRAHPRPGDARHGARGLSRPRPRHPHRRCTAGAGSSARRTSRPSMRTGAAPRWSGRRARTGTCACPTPSVPPRRPSRDRGRPSGPCCARRGTAC